MNDLRFHQFADVYRHIASELGTRSCPRGALGDILDPWIGRIEEGLSKLGHDDAAPDFDAKVRAKLEEQLDVLTRGRAPEELTRVVRTIFDLKLQAPVLDW